MDLTMSISLDDIRAFLSVAKHESFVMAADDLCITPPALSRRIKKLEEFVGDPLFDRTTQMVAITPSGQALLDRAEIVVREFESFQDFAGHFAKDHVIRIRFACMWSTAGSVVPGLIREFTQEHENAEFEVSENNADTVARQFAEHAEKYSRSITWAGSLDKAMATAKESKKPLLLLAADERNPATSVLETFFLHNTSFETVKKFTIAKVAFDKKNETLKAMKIRKGATVYYIDPNTETPRARKVSAGDPKKFKKQLEKMLEKFEKDQKKRAEG